MPLHPIIPFLALSLVTAALPGQTLSLADLSADAAIIVDRTTSRVLWSKNPTGRRPMASTTKMMTALLVIEAVERSPRAPNYATECSFSQAAWDALMAIGGTRSDGGYGSSVQPRLLCGEVLSIDELLQAMLIASDNAAPYVLAETVVAGVAGSANFVDCFAALMNARALELGLRDTHFTNPNGAMNEQHYSSATDLAALAEVALRHQKFRTVVGAQTVTVIGDYGSSLYAHTVDNSNPLLGLDPDVIGVKTGSHTTAGECLVAAAERDGMSLMTVVLGSSDRKADTIKLLAHGWSGLTAHDDAMSYAAGDFDGNGHQDLAVGVPQATAANADGAGLVAVFDGHDRGLQLRTPHRLAQGEGALPGGPEVGGGFGHALTTGDFDGDGLDDLAIGAPWDDHGAIPNTGSVTVVHGSPTGLGTRAQVWHQDTADVPEENESYDAFGQSLASGDFNGDGYDDLAIGIPGEDIEAERAIDAGGVIVLFGSPTGLTAAGALYLRQDSYAMVEAAVETGDGFGWSLVAGHFDADRYADLAIGVPGEDIGDAVDAGMACVRYGSAGGFDSTRALRIIDTDFGDGSQSETDDRLGWSLAAGDFDGNRIDDLAIGAPGEDYNADHCDTGAVLVVYGTRRGLDSSGSEYLYESGGGGDKADHDCFATALVAADFDGDGLADLAAGIPGQDGASSHHGRVLVFTGASTGLGSSGRHYRLDPASTSESRFGKSVGAGRFRGGAVADLAVAIPGFILGSQWLRGATRVFDGDPTGLSVARCSTWSGW